MKAVHKFPLKLTDRTQEVSLPVGAQLLHVAMQRGVPCLWAMVDVAQYLGDPAPPTETRYFRFHGTGERFAIDHDGWGTRPWFLEHVGTVLIDDGALVFHLFEEVSRA